MIINLQRRQNIEIVSLKPLNFLFLQKKKHEPFYSPYEKFKTNRLKFESTNFGEYALTLHDDF